MHVTFEKELKEMKVSYVISGGKASQTKDITSVKNLR